ncbi:hypothetical protein GCK32_008238 [Trichostrongylus colubriformis]|uniref:Mitochondrial fission regulator 2 n=1 Tax=Trichostrongylus colubriformis TaxID=6319 RepID=A0AAN8G7K7_TRICO
MLSMACSSSTRLDNDAISSGGPASACMSLCSMSSKSDQDLDNENDDFDTHVHKSVARTTAGSLELLIIYLEAEIRRVRLFLRDCGHRVRRFCMESMHMDFQRIARLFARLSESGFSPVSMDVSELDSDEAMILNEVPLRQRWKPPKYTFNDIAVVLTTDEEVEDGVVHAYTIRSPAWDRLPSPLPSQHDSESDLKDFQLFNRPMKMTIPAEDEDERLSLPSTMATDQELKIQSLEAQLALLSKQMQTLLAGKVPPPAPAERSSDSSPLISDDEGKGASLCSPSDTMTFSGVKGGVTQPKSVIPPPPPPPPPSLLSTNTTSTSTANTPSGKRMVLQMLNKSTTEKHDALPVRPSASELLTVQLKKTDTVRSPGGTPVDRQLRRTPNDEGNYLANALREKFRSMQETLSEHEDDVNSSWIEDEL